MAKGKKLPNPLQALPQLPLGWILTAIALVWLWGNYGLALWLARDSPWRVGPEELAQVPRRGVPIHLGVMGASGLLAVNLAMRASQAWDGVLRFRHGVPFQATDSVFGRDLGFYLFRLPLYEGVQRGMGELVLWGLVLAIVLYALKGEIRPQRGWKYFLTGGPKTHLCSLLTLLFVLVALGFVFQRFDLLYSPDGVVFGAGYADIHSRLPAYGLMAGVTMAVAALFLVAINRSGFWLPLVGLGFYLVLLVGVVGLYPALQQRLVVSPNELEKERPYLEEHLQATRQAYGLAPVERQEFAVETGLTAAVLEQNQPTLDNVPLWDLRPLLATYRQLQEIRLYYRFQGVDLDRYGLNGSYRQVAIAARELDVGQVPPEAQNWVNQRLKFTHGYGVAMSSVSAVTPEGLPQFLIRNVPPVSTVDIPLGESRIYYGEATRQYVFTGTTTDEFDYPDGDRNAEYRYQGQGGVPMGSWGRRLAYAYELGSLNVLISNYFTPETRIHYYRTIVNRARRIAPFFTYDSDPYPALVGGRLVWILEGYTSSDRYPYAQPLALTGELEPLRRRPAIDALARQGANYVRDAVKVVVDAYDGTLQFYPLTDQDPILNTYRAIFPDLFQPLGSAPPELQAHFRYPQDLFTLQAHLLRTYHMTAANVFYNREDVWRFPRELYEGESVLMEPYSLIMALPGQESPEFVQILPFTPANRDNMVAWLAGRSDGAGYGQQVLYTFPKQELVFGPSQIEARINQSPEISQQLTLWGQEGSRVIRGDLLVIPVARSLLYIEPVYLRAEQNALPELRRVIVAYDDRVAMGETLEGTLGQLFGSSAPATPAATPGQMALPPDLTTQLAAALAAYEASQAALRAGDWPAYGAAQAELGRILQGLQ